MPTPTMDRAALTAWAQRHTDGPVYDQPDFRLSLSSKLLRFHWNGAPTVAVGADADGKTRINATLDALAVALASPDGPAPVVHLLLGTGDTPMTEHLDAIGTLVGELRDGPQVRVWTLTADGTPAEVMLSKAVFTSGTPARWAAMLTSAGTAANDGLGGMAGKISAALAGRASFALYPKLSSLSSPRPWQMRLDGLEIGRTGTAGTVLELASQDLAKSGEPRHTWRDVVVARSRTFGPDQLDGVVALVDRLIERWTNISAPGAVLGHGQAEHALEAHLLSGRLTIHTSAGDRLRPAVPFTNGVLAAAQFPTLWGDVTRPARYLDALLADDDARPWAVELKDQDAGGGSGAYLRHGIGQAVLYRYYIRTAGAVKDWFTGLGLHHDRCQAALAFPAVGERAAAGVGRLRALAALFDVDVVEFPRPGHATPAV